MQAGRWGGLVLMIFAVVTGSVMYYMNRVAAASAKGQPDAPFFDGGTVLRYPEAVTPQPSGTVCTVVILICVAVFIVGAILFLNSDPLAKPRKKRRKKSPINLPQEDANL
jgi:hypothetical protein